MKHLLTILCVLTSFTTLAQFPNTHTQSSSRTKEVFYGAVNPRGGLINGRYADTAAANLDYVAGERGAQIVVGNTIYLRDNTATKWIVAGGYGAIASNITILNDSSISICNGITCDTFNFTNIVVNNFSVVNDSTILVCDGNNVCDTLFIPPTPISKNFVDSTKIRGGDSLFYYINGNEYLGGIISPKSNISIANDSSLVICSSNRCDTFIFNDIIINSFTVVNDSTILVCDGNNTCDTLHITPTPLAKNYVDSVKVDGSLIYYYINGSANLAGVIGGKDGLISGGIVTWSGSGLKFYITSAQYILGGKFYSSPLDSVTLNPADTQSRVDLFIVDTTGHAGKITGVADGNLVTPQVDPASQIALTQGIQINPGDTIPSQISNNVVYDENLGTPNEWNPTKYEGTFTVDFNNLSRPENGVKSIYISSYNGATIYFTGAYQDLSANQNLSFWVYLNGKFVNNMYALLANSSTGAQTNYLPVQGLNRNDSSNWQHIVIPTSYFTWYQPTSNFNRLYLKITGSDVIKGLYVDNISLQKGINSLPPQTDYSNKLDSVLLRNDSLFQYIKGVKTFKGLASGSGVGGGITKLGDSPYGLIKLNDSTYLVDSTLLLTQLMAATTYLNIVDTTDKWIPVGSKFPIGVIKPILALDDSTLAFDSLNLTEIRYSQAARDTATWTDTTLIDKKYFLDRLASYSPGSGTDTTSLSNRINAKQDALTVTTVGASGASTLINDTLNIPQYSGGTDSASVHVGHITVVGDTAIVFTDLRGNSDTISLQFLQYWKKNGNNIYYSGGNVGINVDTPAYNLHIRQATVLTDDNSGLYMQNTDASSGAKISPPITLGAVNNNAGTISYRGFVIRAETPGSSSLSTLKIYPRTNYVTSAFPILSLGDNGALTLPGIITQTAGGTNSFNAGLTTPGQYTSTNGSANSQTRYGFRHTTSTNTASGTIYGFAQDGTYLPGWGAVLIPFSNLNGNNLFNQNSGSTGIGVTSVNNSAKLELADTTKGFLLPRMTKAQRDKIISSITGSITNGGTGYATTSGSAVALTGGSGTGAYGLFVVSGGVVTSMTITIIGTGYKAGDVLSFTGVGTGFTYTISAVGGPAESLQIYQTDNTPGPRYYIGGTWYKPTLTAD